MRVHHRHRKLPLRPARFLLRAIVLAIVLAGGLHEALIGLAIALPQEEPRKVDLPANGASTTESDGETSPSSEPAAPESGPQPPPQPATPVDPLAPRPGLPGNLPPASSTPASAAPSLEEIRAEIRRLETEDTQDPQLRARLIETYQKAARSLEDARRAAAQASEYREQIRTYPESTATVRASFSSLPPDPKSADDLRVPADLDAAGLQRLLASATTELGQLRVSLEKNEESLRNEERRPAAARRELDAARDALARLENGTAAGRPPSTDPSVRAEEIARAAEREAYRATIDKLEQEILSYDERIEWLAVSRDWTARQVSALEARARLLETLLQQRREADAQAAREETMRAQERSRGKHPLVESAARRNSELGAELARVTELLGEKNRERQRERETLEQLESDFRDARYQLERGGLTEGLGEILRDQKRRLPDALEIRRRLRQTSRVVGEAALAQYRFGEERKAIADPSRFIASLLGSHQPTPSASDSDEIAVELRTLIEDREPLLAQIIARNTEILETLAEIESIGGDLLEAVGAYKDFLDEHLLWIPSASAISAETFSDFTGAIVWLLSPAGWEEVLAATIALPMERALLASALLIVSLALVGFRRRLYRSLEDISLRVGRVTTDGFSLTVRALLFTVALASPIPLLLGFVGWELLAEEHTPFAQAIGSGLFALSKLLFVFAFVLLLCRPRGVAEVHFRWRDRTLKLLRTSIFWFAPISLTAILLTSITDAQPVERFANGLGRVAFVARMVALTIFFRRILRPHGGVFESFLAEHPDGWLFRLRGLWYPLALAVPFSLAVLAALGYYYTSLELDERLTTSLWLVIGAIVVHQSALRWLLIEQRKLAIEKIRQKRRLSSQAGKDSGELSLSSIEVVGHGVDISTVNEQTRHLVRTLLGFVIVVGLWMIWAGVLPALAFLNAKELWTYTIGEMSYPVTLGMLALAAIFISFTAVAARNLPGVLEIVILKNLPLDPGSRYAITTICQYLIVAAGVVIAFNTIGIGWVQVQWLVAAIGVGLGFGLQEVFANFVSGLVLLFERPIRVGDIVTIGDVSGVVSRIRIRATTITNWDRRELVVPNKEFITGRVLNWTLTSSVNRISLNVSVPHDADPQKVQAILLQVAADHPLVLDEPPPMALLDELGPSALNFVLRCFLRDLERRLAIIHDLHTGILAALHKEGIALARPQQDLHLRSADATLRLDASGAPELDGSIEPDGDPSKWLGTGKEDEDAKASK